MTHERRCARNLLSNLTRYSDISLISERDQTIFQVHRHIIIESSDFFASLLNNDNLRELALTDIDGSVLEEILHYIYIGYIDLNRDNIEDITLAASFMRIISLKDRCERFLQNHLAVENCLQFLLLLDKCEITNGPLKAEAVSLLCANFNIFFNRTEFMQIHGNTFIDILNCDDLGVPEIDIFNCVVRWVQEDKTERSRFVPDLLRLIRLPKLPGEVLCSAVEEFFTKYGLVALVKDEYKRRMMPYNPSWQNRSPEGNYQRLHYAEFHSQKRIHIYRCLERDNRSRWENCDIVEHTFPSRNGLGWVHHAQTLYILGASSAHSRELSTDARQWIPLPQMRSAGTNFVAIAYDRFIYVFGGCTTSGSIREWERFDTRDHVWNLLPSLPVNLFNYYAIEMGGNFYVAGEYDPGTHELRVVIYCFHLANRAWNEMTTFPDAPSITSMTKSGDGKIYFTFNDLSVHLYDPADNTWVGIGHFPPHMRILRTINYAGQIYALYQDAVGEIVKFGRAVFTVGNNVCYFDDTVETRFNAENLGLLYVSNTPE